MVLSFALCATFAFAQTNKSVTKAKVADRASVAVSEEVVAKQAGYTGSIFTKDDELFVCGFTTADSNIYSPAAVGAGEQVNGTAIPQHQQTAFHSTWRRLPGNVESAINANPSFGTTNYPATANPNLWGWGWIVCGTDGGTPFASNTAEDGIMIMTMMDQISQGGWGGHGTTGNFDAYIQFSGISTVGEPLVRVRFYQFYRCFNSDQCWIDYRANGGAWSGIEINVARVDVAVNGNTKGWKTITMPTAVANQNSVDFRIRWSCTESNGAYGYFWLVDDFMVIPALENSLRLQSNQYFEGFYQMMPQNLQVPVVWAAEFANDGRNTQNDFTGHLYTFADGDANAVELVNKNIGTVVPDPLNIRSVVIDPLGWYDSTADGHGWAYQNGSYATGTYACLPTATTGNRHFFSDLTTDHYSVHLFGDTGTFDTLLYKVNWNTTPEGHPYGVWARDHGVIRSGSYYAAGLVSAGTFSSTVDPNDATNPMWDQAGYSVFVSYVTGSQVPVDGNGNPWRILGMEMTPSTRVGFQSPGSRLEPILYQDVCDSAGTLHFYGIDHGASTYVVQPTDVISNTILADTVTPLTYELYGEATNPTIKIMFLNQPELEANTSYRVGYSLAEEAQFAVATSGNYFYNEEGTATGFYDEPGMASYGNALGIVNRYTVMVADPYDGKIHMFNTSQYPMIRLLVGPYYYVPKVAVSLECDNPDFGGFMNGNYDDLCGMVDSVPVNGSCSYLVMPQPGYKIDKVYRDGVEIEYEERTDADSNKYGVVSLENVVAATTLRCTFKQDIGFDPVASVSMRLQPNPATSNVRVVMKGVTGNVNMALIDMSGRVVTTSQFNAENGTTINVSNLAKGAYFVRITNNKFSKIEKLIVR